MIDLFKRLTKSNARYFLFGLAGGILTSSNQQIGELITQTLKTSNIEPEVLSAILVLIGSGWSIKKNHHNSKISERTK